MHIVLFEDLLTAELHPLTLARPAFALTIGGVSLWEAVGRLAPEDEVAWVVRPEMADVTRLRHTPGGGTDRPGGALPREGAPTLFLNARLAAPLSRLRDLLERARDGEEFCLRAAGQPDLIAAVAWPRLPWSWGDETPASLAARFAALFAARPPDTSATGEVACLLHPWDVVRLQPELLSANLPELLRLPPRAGEAAWTAHAARPGLWTRGDVALPACFEADTSDGPILLDDGVKIGPFAFLKGPLLVGPHSTIVEHASVKSNTTIGAHCKVGGEVHSTTFESFSNKGHHGFIGHAWIGSWVNLGAGTTNSNLKNTYGEISVEQAGRRHATGMQFLGCMIGDYSKTAINTSIFTGKIVGVSSHLYGFVGSNVPSFCNWARTMGQITEFRLEAALATMGRMYRRRGLTSEPADEALLRGIFEQTRGEREGFDDRMLPM